MSVIPKCVAHKGRAAIIKMREVMGTLLHGSEGGWDSSVQVGLVEFGMPFGQTRDGVILTWIEKSGASEGGRGWWCKLGLTGI